MDRIVVVAVAVAVSAVAAGFGLWFVREQRRLHATRSPRDAQRRVMRVRRAVGLVVILALVALAGAIMASALAR